MIEIYLISMRKISKSPAQGCVNEFENVVVDVGGHLIQPLGCESEVSFLKHFEKLKGLPGKIDIPKKTTSGTQILIIASIGISEIARIIARTPDIEKRFDIVCAYVFDAFLQKKDTKWYSWKKHYLKKLNHLFIPMTGSLREFKEVYGVPVSYVPMASDVMKYGSSRQNRHIDIIGYGRQHREHSRLLAKEFNFPGANGLYYHTNHMIISQIKNFSEHRNMFWNVLNSSRIAMAYDPDRVDPRKRFPFSFVGQRWFESVAAGCMVAGLSPTCQEMKKLFDWEDSTVEVPEEPENFIPFMRDLLSDNERLENSHKRNYYNALLKHDWRLRIRDILNHLGVDCPAKLKEGLEKLEEKASQHKF